MPECNDRCCPVHGQIKVRGNVFTGIVVSDKPSKTVKVERVLFRRVPKYERYRKIRSRIAAHAPECFKVSEGDEVRIGETRKISKTKSFVVMEVIARKEARKRIKVKAEVAKTIRERAAEKKAEEAAQEAKPVKEELKSEAGKESQSVKAESQPAAAEEKEGK
jgi:small subunit ribosomal protein S17